MPMWPMQQIPEPSSTQIFNLWSRITFRNSRSNGTAKNTLGQSDKLAVKHIVLSNLFSIIHHHHQSELVGDVAVPVSVRQAVLFCALRSPDARPRLNRRRSTSTVLSQVCLGRPGRRLQFLGAGDMQACRARE